MTKLSFNCSGCSTPLQGDFALGQKFKCPACHASLKITEIHDLTPPPDPGPRPEPPGPSSLIAGLVLMGIGIMLRISSNSEAHTPGIIIGFFGIAVMSLRIQWQGRFDQWEAADKTQQAYQNKLEYSTNATPREGGSIPNRAKESALATGARSLSQNGSEGANVGVRDFIDENYATLLAEELRANGWIVDRDGERWKVVYPRTLITRFFKSSHQFVGESEELRKRDLEVRHAPPTTEA